MTLCPATPLTPEPPNPPAAGEFYSPSDVAIANDGSLFVVDSGNSRVQKLDAGGTFLKVFGTAGDGKLNNPLG